MCEVIRTFKPDVAAIEELFFNTNITTGISVAQGRGVILLACYHSGVPVYEYTPLQVKQAVVGFGRAEKTPGHRHGKAHTLSENGPEAGRRG